LALLLTIFLSGFLYAEESGFYVKTVPIARVYMHKLGYRVVYQKSDLNFAVFYVPKRWFDLSGTEREEPKAELVLTNERTVPYFSIFWKDGQFSHIRLYLHRDLQHDSYGDLKDPTSLDDKFNIESLDLEF
jgi:hypothetical protein